MIRIGKYGLEPDTHCWMLGEWYEHTDKKTGEKSIRLRNVTYPSTIEHAMTVLMRKRLKECDAETVADLLREVREFRAEMSERFTIKVEAA